MSSAMGSVDPDAMPERYLEASAAMACASLSLVFDPETRGQLTHEQRLEIVWRVGYEAMQARAGRANVPEVVP